ncbi:hypothetical protein Tco_0957086 [Tanacetum coccineum]
MESICHHCSSKKGSTPSGLHSVVGQYAGQIAGNHNGYNAVQNVGNRVIQNVVQTPGVQNVGNQNGLIIVLGIAPSIANHNANQNGNGNVVAARAEGNENGNNGNQIRIQLQAEEFDLMAAARDIDEIEDVNANCVLMANLHCYDNEIFNMFTQEEQYTELLKPISEPHQVQQNNSNVIPDASSVEQSGGIVDHNPATAEEIRAHFESLYNNLATKVKRVNMVNRIMRETNADLTTELARYKIGYRILIDLIFHRSSINNSASLSNKFGGFYFIFKFGISGLLHHVVTAIADRIRGTDKSKITRKQSKASKHGHENQKSTKPKPKP